MRLAMAMLAARLGGATALALPALAFAAILQAAVAQTAVAQPAPAPPGPQLAPPAPPPIGAAAGLAAALPTEAAGFTRAGLTDFEARPGGAGLGAAAEYRPTDGSSGVATVYHYTHGLAGLPEGTAAPAVEQELQSAVAEIRSVGHLRRYGLASQAEAPPIPAPGGQPALRCLAMLLVYEGGVRAADSFVCVGVVRGRFLKLRLTLPTERQGETQPRLEAFGRAVVAALATPG